MTETILKTELNEDGSPKVVEAAVEPTAEELAAAESDKVAQAAATPESPKELSDEDFLAEVEKRTGRKVTSIDELKAPKPEPTEEEKKKELTAKDKRLLDLHIEKGGTVETFVQWKSLASADVKDLSIKKTIAEYVAMGLTEDEAKAEIKNRYYQLSDEEIAELDEDDRAAAIAKKEKWGVKLYNRANGDITNSTKYLQSLEQIINDQADDEKEDARLSAEAESIAKTFERKMSVGLGDFKGLNLTPVEHTISESDFAEVIDTVKDKTKREALLYNDDGTEKISMLIDYLVLKKRFNEVVSKAAAQAATEQVEAFEKIATRNPKELEGYPNSQKNQISANKILQIGRKTFVN
jgi:hypothetical protein